MRTITTIDVHESDYIRQSYQGKLTLVIEAHELEESNPLYITFDGLPTLDRLIATLCTMRQQAATQKAKP